MKDFLVFLILAGLFCLFSCRKDDSRKDAPSSNLKEGTVKVTRVKVAGVNAGFDAGTSTFTAVLPGVTDFSSLGLVFTTEANVIRAGNQELMMSNSGIDLSSPLTVRFIKNGFIPRS